MTSSPTSPRGLNAEILRLAIPNILSNISVPLLSTVDTALMGRLSAEHIGAVGLGSMIFNFVYWNLGFLRMGSTGLTAQAYGRDSREDMSHVLGRATVVAMALSVVIVLLQWPLAQGAFYLLNVPADQIGLVGDYYYMRIWDAPATLGLYALMGWFFGMQNAIYPLILTLFINVINIGFSVYFVRVAGMEATGVALGTVVAQYAGLLLGGWLLWRRYPWVIPQWRWRVLAAWSSLRPFLRLHGDIFLRTLCLTFAFGFFYSRSAAGGELLLAANIILLQFLNWMSYGVDGFAYAAESLVGKYFGRKEEAETHRAIRYSLAWGMALALLYTLLYGLLGEVLLRVFTNQEEVLTVTRPLLWWMAIFPLLSTPCYLWDGIFIGLTASRSMRDTMLLALAGYLIFYYTLGNDYGNDGLWSSLLLLMALRGALQYGWYRKYGLDIH